jgi:glutaredoxin
MNVVTFFTKPDCTLCHGALYVVKRVRVDVPFDLEIVDISATGSENWWDAYRNDIPVVHLNGEEIFRHRVDERRLRELLQP